MGYETSAERWSPVQSVEKILLSVVSMLAGEIPRPWLHLLNVTLFTHGEFNCKVLIVSLRICWMYSIHYAKAFHLIPIRVLRLNIDISGSYALLGCILQAGTQYIPWHILSKVCGIFILCLYSSYAIFYGILYTWNLTEQVSSREMATYTTLRYLAGKW